MQPHKYVAVSCEDRSNHLRLGWRQWIVSAVTTVVEQHGRKRPFARRAPHLCAERQRSGSHVDDFIKRCGLARGFDEESENRDGETSHADDQDMYRAFHDMWIYHVNSAA